jgi:chitin disaccharide deacetylase
MSGQPSISVYATVFLLSSVAGLSAQEPTGPRYLIIHADDAGMCHSHNVATIEAMEKGVVSSASIMVPCAWFPEMADYAKKHPERDFGVHLTLTSEWKHYRWGPVAPRGKVPSLLDEQGFMWARVSDVARHAKLDEVEIELRAQIDRAIAFGVPITHLDTHMGSMAARGDLLKLYVKLGLEYDQPIMVPRQMSQADKEEYADVTEQAEAMFAALAKRGLPVIDYLPTVPTGSEFEAKKAVYLRWFEELKPGVTQLILHCGVDGPELSAVTGSHANRDTDRRVFCDPDIAAKLDECGIRVIGWKELREINQRKSRRAAGNGS